MKEVAGKIGVRSFSRDLVADLCNLAAGGKVSPPSAYREQVRSKADETLPAPDSKGRWTGRNGGYTDNRQRAVDAATEKSMKYHQNVCDFLQAVNLEQFPGQTPLEQAMSLLKLLSAQSGGSGGGEGSEPLPIFVDVERPEGIAEKLEDLMETVDSLSQEELDMVDPNGQNHEVEDQDGQKSGGQELNKLKIAEDLVEGSDKRVMLDISRQLDQFTKLQVRKQVKLEEDSAGEEVRQRPIRNLGELGKVAKPAWAMRQQNETYFLYQAVTGQMPVRERVTRIERKQAIFILVDGSGSMYGKKHFKASGVVMNRLKAVISGDAEVWVSVFDTTLTKAQRARTPEEARELIKKFTNGNFRGGGTDIAVAIKAAHKQIDDAIKAGEALYRPEIVVLTDDDTSVSGCKPSEIPGTRVHGFAIESRNPALVALAKATGGLGVEKF
ncbi:MAG: VWA domain-containing protein [Patescibacteria group bacterium]